MMKLRASAFCAEYMRITARGTFSDPAPLSPGTSPIFFENGGLALGHLPVMEVYEVLLRDAQERASYSRAACLIECVDLEGFVVVDEFGREQLLDLQSETTGDSQQDLERDVRGD